MKMKSYLFVVVGILAGIGFALPAPTEYTMALLDQDLHSAQCVALVEAVDIDTVFSGQGAIFQYQHVTLKIEKCYKGGVPEGDSLLVTVLNLSLVGGYNQDWEIGLRSIVCLTDGWKDGETVSTNSRGKFDVGKDDSIVPPPVGYGFSDEFNYYRTFDSFEQLVEQTILGGEYIQFMPILAHEGNEVKFATSINLSGGSTLNSVRLESLSSRQNTFALILTYTPCTSAVCPMNFFIADTAVSAGTLPAGEYHVLRFEDNTLSAAPFPVATDSIVFTVYQNTDIEPAGAERQERGIRCAPNPFNPSVTVSFNNPGKKAGVKIYNLQGKLVHSFSKVAGDHVVWNAAGFSSGIFIVRAAIGSQVYAKMIFLQK